MWNGKSKKGKELEFTFVLGPVFLLVQSDGETVNAHSDFLRVCLVLTSRHEILHRIHKKDMIYFLYTAL